MNRHMSQKLFWFQLFNFGFSCVVQFTFPNSIFGGSLIYVLFSFKIIALLYLNDYPEKKDLNSLVFFALACVEVILLFWTGSFSIYTFAFSRF